MPENENTSTQKRLTDDELTAAYPAVLALVLRVEDVARRAPDPSVGELASALADYFRNPDAI